MTKPLHDDPGSSVEEELDALQANAARDAQDEERFAWTILLTVPSGRLRWRSIPYRLPVIPDEQDKNDQRDATLAGIEAWQRETRNSAAFDAWATRLRHLGLLKPQRETPIPDLPTSDGCQCSLCLPSPRAPWSPCRQTANTNNNQKQRKE